MNSLVRGVLLVVRTSSHHQHRFHDTKTRIGDWQLKGQGDILFYLWIEANI